LLNERPSGWFERPWVDEIADALSAAVRELQARFGPSPDGWAWGHSGPLILAHPFASRPPLNRVYNLGPFPYGGDDHTIAAAFRSPRDPSNSPRALPNLRVVLDVGNWEENRFVLAGGESGNPLSPHYDDLLALWQRGEGITMPWARESVAQAAQSTLSLEPSSPD
jgi:penicillin amidase